MYKPITEFEIDMKSRFVKLFPVENFAGKDMEALRNGAREAIEKAFGSMPKANLSLNNNYNDPRSLVRVDKYEISIVKTPSGNEAIMLRSRPCDTSDAFEIQEFEKAMRAVENYIKLIKM